MTILQTDQLDKWDFFVAKDVPAEMSLIVQRVR